MPSPSHQPSPRLLLALLLPMGIAAGGCSGNDVASVAVERASSGGERYPTVIRTPPLSKGFEQRDVGAEAPHRAIATGRVDHAGRPVTIACGTCHVTHEPKVTLRDGALLRTFHTGLHTLHGNLACVACHDPDSGYENLKLADGSKVAFADSMRLCAQCHGVQVRDYRHGTHGGMTGYWDTTRGPRERNHCLHCHDAHAPQYPVVLPVAGPRDRFPPATHGADHD